MTKIKVGINGFGRIGRVTARLLCDDLQFELVAINDLTPLDQSAHLLRYDSVHGPFKRKVSVEKDKMVIDNRTVKMFSLRDPVEIPWKDFETDVVIESTGIFTNYE